MKLHHLRRLAGLAALAGLLFVAYATLSPLQDRPHVASQGLEHVAAFAVLGALLTFAHPRRTGSILGFLVLAAIGLEAAQHLAPDRHGTLLDVARKIAGAGLGVGVGWMVERVLAARLEARG